jgi:hypothetical protein
MTAASQTVWPEGVIARFLTVAGSGDGKTTVDVIETEFETREFAATCLGCGEVEHFKGMAWHGPELAKGVTLDKAKRWAQEHAEKCRAMARP